MPAVLVGLGSCLVAALITLPVARFARSRGMVDEPGVLLRKQQAIPVPLLGGVAIFLSTVISLVIARGFGLLPGVFITDIKLLGLLSGGFILMVGGFLDDRFRLQPRLQLLFPLFAAGCAVLSGVVIPYVRNPFGGILDVPYALGAVLTFGWILGTTYTTKLLDGLDGLAAGIGVIAAVLFVALSMRAELNQPDTALLGAAFGGALLGFLLFNFFPARIYLGEGGSTLIGFLIGSLAVAAGSKVATTLLILGIPILDVGAIIIQRLRAGRPLAVGDRLHLHYRLLDLGLSPRRTVLLLWSLAALFGLAGIIFDTRAKILALLVLGGIMVALLWITSRRTTHAS